MSRQNRWLGASALLALAAAAAAGGRFVSNREESDRQEIVNQARSARERTIGALAAWNRSRETRAATAATLGPLVAGLDSGYDAGTWQDALDTESWWEPLKTTSAYTALLVGDKLMAATGPEKVNPASSDLVVRARRKQVASGVLRGQLNNYFASAARVIAAERAQGEPVVLLGEAIDEKSLAGIVARLGEAVGVSDGRRMIESAGPAEPRQLLPGIVGRESSEWTAPVNGWLAVAVPLEPNGGPWLWSISQAPLVRSAPVARAALWGTSGALAVGALLLFISASTPSRRRPRATPAGHGAGGAGGLASAPQGPTQVALPSSEIPAVPSTAPFPLQRQRDKERERERAQSPGGGVPASSHVHRATQALAAAPAHGPNTMGRYTLLEKIGEGGMAEVFLAAAFGPEGFKRYFVVKRLHPNLARRRDVVNQFIDEARLQGRLLHENIVPVFDFGHSGGEYFLALEYVHGRDLEKVVSRHHQVFGQPLPLSVSAFVMHEIMQALEYAHHKTDETGRPMEIVHRDVSPGNILVSYRGEVKLSDFGIVKAGQRLSRTDVGLVKGNASYMSPEQARGDVVDSRSDIFSAAVVMFYTLTGQALYGGETTLNQLMVRAAVGLATAQFDQIGSLPSEIAPLLAKALALEPANRFATAGEFARELAPLVDGGKAEMAELMARLFPTEMRKDLA